MIATDQGRRGALKSLLAVPGAGLALLPSFGCPLCLAAYSGVLSTLGLTFLLNERVLAPLVATFLVIGFSSVAWSRRAHRRGGPLALTFVGTAVTGTGRLVLHHPTLTYVGAAILFAGAAWNFALKAGWVGGVA